MKSKTVKLRFIVTTLLICSLNYIIAQTGPYVVGKCGFPPPSCALVPASSPAMLCTGGSIELYAVSVYPVPVGSYTFQWWHITGTPPFLFWDEIDGATSTKLTAAASSTYKCYVTPDGGTSYYTQEIVVEIANALPTIQQSPGNSTICTGSNVSFSVSASGEYLHFQWRKQSPGSGFININGANSSIYSYTPPSTDDGAQLYCLAINGCAPNGIQSDIATLDIILNPDVTINPVDKTICQEGNTSFSVTATGDISTYSWEHSTDNVNFSAVPAQAPFSGTGTSQLALTNTQVIYNNYYFRCKLFNNFCYFTDYSSGAKLSVQTRLVVSNAPSGNYYVCDGSPATFSVVYSGTSPISVQWQEYINGWNNMTGQTSSTLTFPVSLLMNNRQYRAVLNQANTCNMNIETSAGTLFINSLPKINIQPQDQEECTGEDATFSVSGSGTNITYQWQINRNNGLGWADLTNSGHYSGVSTTNLIVSNLQDSLNGYNFRCKIAGSCNPTVTSNSSLLTINTVPKIIVQPQDTAICYGESVTLSVNADSNIPMKYRWKKGGQAITDWLNYDTLFINAVTLDNENNYQVEITNDCALSTPASSDLAYLDVLQQPYINLNTVQHLCPGNSLELDAGADFEYYYWSTGENTRAISVTEQGDYTLDVTDTNGCSNTTLISVYMDPAIPEIDIGDDKRFCKGEMVFLDATDLYDTYIWRKGIQNQKIISNTQITQVSETDTFTVVASKTNSVCKAMDTIYVIIAEPYDGEEICLMTIDLFTGKNLVIWEKTNDMGTELYRIYRQTNIVGKYELIGEVPFNNLSIFIDETADPEQRQWVYKITAVDTCGNESDYKLSPYHRPLFLYYNGTDDGVNLTWEPYVVEGTEMQFLTYEIYRGTDSTALTKINEISSDLRVFKDIDPKVLANKYYYRVAGVKAKPCYPTGTYKADSGPYSHSMSNIEDNRFQVGLNNPESARPLTIYPNPASDIVTIEYSNPEKDKYLLVIRDLTGKSVLIINNITEDKIVIESHNLKEGYYTVELAGANIYQGRLIVNK